MRDLIRAIVAMLAAIPRLILVPLWIAGRWILRLVADPAQPRTATVDLAAQSRQERDNERRLADDAMLSAIGKTTAAKRYGFAMPPELKGQSRLIIRWLMELDASMCELVMRAPNDLVLAHTRWADKRSIVGVHPVWNDEEYLEYMTAKVAAQSAAGRSKSKLSALQAQFEDLVSEVSAHQHVRRPR